MGGGLMQLVAYGAQDIYLTGNPQITFFKVVYRRHTNFSMESISQSFNGQADFGQKVNCTISRNGDLIHRVYLQVELPQVTTGDAQTRFRWLNWLGHVIVKQVEITIGGQLIDKHYGTWLHIWNELSQTAGHKVGYAAMVGNVPRLTQIISDAGVIPSTMLYIPLQFWFCRNPGLALPLIALQYHEVKINIEFNSLKECYYSLRTDTNNNNADSLFTMTGLSLGSETNLYVDYIYLDTAERQRFAQVSHEYLIEQLQFTGSESIPANQTNNKIRMNFNHPVKEIVWVVQPDDNVNADQTKYTGGKQHFNFTDAIDKSYYTGTPGQPLGEGMIGPNDAPNNHLGLTDASGNIEGSGTNNFFGTTTATGWENYLISNGLTASGAGTAIPNANGPYLFDSGNNPIVSAKIQLNGHDRLSERKGTYFNLVQPYQHHTNVPACGINVYSFALKPEEHQPSGTCNMSRIDQAELKFELTSACTSGTSTIRIYAVNYNVLRIMSGMGGLAYSN